MNLFNLFDADFARRLDEILSPLNLEKMIAGYGPEFNGRGRVTDAEIARRRARNKAARIARRRNRR